MSTKDSIDWNNVANTHPAWAITTPNSEPILAFSPESLHDSEKPAYNKTRVKLRRVGQSRKLSKSKLPIHDQYINGYLRNEIKP